jgi:hypothetical protein
MIGSRQLLSEAGPARSRLASYPDATALSENQQTSGINTLTPANAARRENGCFSLQPVAGKDVRICKRRVCIRQPFQG